jgi:hypothetical protein
MKFSRGLGIVALLISTLTGCSTQADPKTSAEISQITVENSLLTPSDVKDFDLEATYIPGQRLPKLEDSFDKRTISVDFGSCPDLFELIYLSEKTIPTASTWAWTAMYQKRIDDEMPVLISQQMRVNDNTYAKIVNKIKTSIDSCQTAESDGMKFSIKPLEVGTFGEQVIAINLSGDDPFSEYSQVNNVFLVIGYGNNFISSYMILGNDFSVSRVSKIASIMDSKFSSTVSSSK